MSKTIGVCLTIQCTEQMLEALSVARNCKPTLAEFRKECRAAIESHFADMAPNGEPQTWEREE